MAISKTAGSRFFISPVAVNPDTINAMSDENAVLFFEGIADWIEVEEKEDLGEHGDTAEEITFAAIKDARVRKLKAARNAGTKAVVVGRDPLDAGQQALRAAEKTDFNYAFKVQYADARSPQYTDSVEYFAGLVLSRPTNQGQQNNVVRQTFNISINTAVYEVPSEQFTT